MSLKSEESRPFINVDKDHWDSNWKNIEVAQPLSSLNVFNRDAIGLLKEKIRRYRHPTVVEIGFVPGKFLLFLEKNCDTVCYGYDYSETGCEAAKKFLNHYSSRVSIHCQDVLKSPPSSRHQAKLVYSIGVVEHFLDPTGMIEAHLKPLASDGVCLIILPNYSGFNYKFQKLLDPENLAIHNLDTMAHSFWDKYSKKFPEYEFKVYAYGRINPWMYSLQKYGKAGRIIQLTLNFASFIFPKHKEKWAGMFVIEISKR